MHPLDRYFRDSVAGASTGSARMLPEPVEGRIEFWWRVFEAQATSRHLDFKARELQRQGRGFYTIASAGHESNALVALALRPSDPALLHYRSGAFYVARAQQVPGSTPARDVLQGLMALADEPIAGGRHKVFGHPGLGIIPQTSTVASHLPRAVGLAVALHRAYRLGVPCEWPEDAVVVCSFGDASVNHSTAAGAINTAVNAAFRGLPVPALFVCEDNGWGISVPTPPGWVEAAYGRRPGLTYLAADGTEPAAAAELIAGAVRTVREQRRPAFLHLKTVRFLGHAGSDAEIAYRRDREITADFARDPLLPTARELVRAGASAADVLARYEGIRAAVDDEAERLTGGRRLGSATEVMAPIAPRHPDEVAEEAKRLRSDQPPDKPQTLAESINTTLDQILAADRRVVVFGEDTGVKGGVYGVTRGLARRHGAARVFDTVLDEQSILGLGLGAGLAGLIPIPEIQYLAYLHNAEDQLRGEGATLPFFSHGRFRNPMVVRVAGLAYQRGFGGHFHNDNALGVLRDIPGLVVACPARADDAAGMLRTCVAAAITDATLSVFLEPIALYHRRDLYAEADGNWLAVDSGAHAPIGRARSYQTQEPTITLITFGNGVPMSLRVARRLAGLGIGADVLDLRWLAPLPVADLLAAVRRTGRALVVDETRQTGGVGEGVVTALVEAGLSGETTRVASADSFVPLGPAAQHVLLSEADIEKAAITLAGTGPT
jgi:2-oxoisovalerate dehydrogenase E1 component